MLTRSRVISVFSDHTFWKSKFIPSDRSSKDFICLSSGVLIFFLLLTSFIVMSSDSVLDDILAAVELLTVSEAAPPVSPGVGVTPVARTLPRRGVKDGRYCTHEAVFSC